MSNHEEFPYYRNQFHQKLRLFGDAANLMLATYGAPASDWRGRPIDIVSWDDTEIASSYVLSGFQPEAPVNSRILHQLSLKCSARHPNGETSAKIHSINPVTIQKSARILLMTTAERIEYEARLANAISCDEGKIRILPPRPNEISPEHGMELLLRVLDRGFMILES